MHIVPPGIPSLPRLESWLAANVANVANAANVPDAADEPVSLTSIELIAGGRSNLTYRLVLTGPEGERVYVLRRPPLGHVLPTAHDMSREFRVLSGLSGTRVPVARPVAICADPEVIGAPFYVMDYVLGEVLRSRKDTAVLTPVQAAELSEDLAGMLAAIHGVDLAATGLADLGRGAGYLRRQLDRCNGNGSCRQREKSLATTRWSPA